MNENNSVFFTELINYILKLHMISLSKNIIYQVKSYLHNLWKRCHSRKQLLTTKWSRGSTL